MEDDTFKNVKEAAAYLGVGETAIRNAVLQKRLPATERYGRKVIAVADLDAYRERTQVNGVPLGHRPKKAAESVEAE